MVIPERCTRISALLDRVKRYDAIVTNDNFTEDALAEMKANATDILKEARDELVRIKDEVDDW